MIQIRNVMDGSFSVNQQFFLILASLGFNLVSNAAIALKIRNA